jgi:cellulose synthase operon protein B
MNLPKKFVYPGEAVVGLCWAAVIGSLLALAIGPVPTAQAQSPTPTGRAPGESPSPGVPVDLTPSPDGVKPAKTSDVPPVQPQVDPQISTPAKPYVNPLAAGQYVLEFNRSPVVGQRLRLKGIYDESRLQFTRPRSWQAKGAKVMLRYRHSPALYATRSNLTVLVNGTSVGSVPLNRKQGEIGTTVYDIPASIIRDYNEVVIAALQNNSPTCTQDPFDPSLWTEVMPDSKLVFDFTPQPVTLDFSRYPYPLFDTLSMEPNRISYWVPPTVDEAWLTGATRFQAGLGRLAKFRPLETRLLKPGETLQPAERVVVIGTPQAQPGLAGLKLPIGLQNNQLLDDQQRPLPPDVGVVAFTTAPESNNLVLIASGNGPEGVAKAVQFLVQARDRQIGTGQTILVKELAAVPKPDRRDWPAYLPRIDNFPLKTLKDYDNQPLSDITVRGADAPIVDVDFRALPDDRFEFGNVMNLRFSYSPQVNPLTSMVEVQLDGVPVVGKRLTSEQGALREQITVPLPEERIKPYSKLQVRFQLDPRERRSCNRATDQQLWATVHADTDFSLKRQHSAKLPNLQLLQYGYPFAAPQDLSETALVVPNQPTSTDLLLLLGFAERLGRLSRADSIQLSAYRGDQLPEAVRNQQHLVAIGTQAKFPLPEAFKAEGFALQDLFARQRDQSQIKTLPDTQGLLKEIVSPWNPQRVLLALSGQTDAGLDQVRDVLRRDDLFFQLKEDTVLVSANPEPHSNYDPQAYTLEFLQKAQQQQELSDRQWSDRLLAMLQGNWLFVAPAVLGLSLLLYGVGQNYLARGIRGKIDEN